MVCSDTVIFMLLTPLLELVPWLWCIRPVGPVPMLKSIPAVHGVPANTDGIAQEVLYDRTS
jgi:hypothetical protein